MPVTIISMLHSMMVAMMPNIRSLPLSPACRYASGMRPTKPKIISISAMSPAKFAACAISGAAPSASRAAMKSVWSTESTSANPGMKSGARNVRSTPTINASPQCLIAISASCAREKLAPRRGPPGQALHKYITP